MTRIWMKLWRDTSGAVSAVSVLLLYTILILGMIVGLSTLRNQFVQEFGDLAVALDHLEQSWQVQYSWEATPRGWIDPGPTLTDPDEEEPAGISVQKPPIDEGQPLP